MIMNMENMNYDDFLALNLEELPVNQWPWPYGPIALWPHSLDNLIRSIS